MLNNTNFSTLYVSQSFGNDSNMGIYPSSDKEGMGPLKTIEKALWTVAVLRRCGAAYQPITIKVMDEVYNVTKPVIIEEAVSSVTIEPVNQTLISGAIEVKNFKKDTFNGVSCFCADLSGYEALEFTDFYVNKKAAQMPKYPEKGTIRAESVENSSLDFGLSGSSKWFIAKEEDFEIIKNFTNIEDSIISFNHWWIDEHTPIESVDIETRKITFKYKSRASISMASEKTALNYVIENVPQMFKNPGEWYYDKTAKKLYYIPEDNAKAEDITGYIPVTDKIFCFSGKADKKVKDVCIKNFDIAYTKGEYKSLGTVNGDFDAGYASDPQSVCNAHGGIEFENSYSCAIENCKLYCFGVHCIVLKDGSQNIRITGNDITNIGAGGISMSGGAFGSDEKTHTCRNIISNNKILYCGNRYLSACGILMRHTYENTVSHNEIGYLYYTGISCGWVWGYDDSICHHNIIEKNHIHHLGQGKLSDMGGVYLLGKQPGTVVRNNLIHDIKSKNYGGWALYPDEGTSYVVLENNVCYNASDSLFHQHYGTMNVVRNNIFAFGGKYPVMYSNREPHIGILLERNIIIAKDQPAFCIGYSPENKIGNLTENDPGILQEIVSTNNIIFDIEKEVTAVATKNKRYSLKETQRIFGIDTDSIEADPRFYDFKKLNFALKENSPAYKTGFKDIDISDVGCIR